jgi:hypothetical protein
MLKALALFEDEKEAGFKNMGYKWLNSRRDLNH